MLEGDIVRKKGNTDLSSAAAFHLFFDLSNALGSNATSKSSFVGKVK